MNIDKIEDINVLRNLLKKVMVKMRIDVATSTHVYQKGEYYFFTQEGDEEIFLYLDNPNIGLMIEGDEIEDFLDWG